MTGRARETDLPGITEVLCHGGWPASIGAGIIDARQYVRDYLGEAHRFDTGHSVGSRRDPVVIRRLLRSLARNTATEGSLATLAAGSGGERPLHRDTVRNYVNALERVFVVEDQPAWSVRLRSRSRLRRTGKRHFVDPSLAVAALRTGSRRLQRDLEFLGLLFESLAVRDLRAPPTPAPPRPAVLLFESLAVRDLRVYAGVHDGEVSITVITRDLKWMQWWRPLAESGSQRRSNSAETRP